MPTFAQPYIVKVLECSTAHITSKDNDLLNQDGMSAPAVYKFEYGHFVYAENVFEEQETLAKTGFSEQFIRILKKANSEGCKFVQFDCDGMEYNDLEKFNW